MRVFVTGGSGWVGRGLLPELIAHGHHVTALARTDAAGEALRGFGADVLPGSLEDHQLLHDAASRADGVVHLAFRHDIAFAGDYARAARDDRAAIDAIAGALTGSGRPFVVPSGILGVLGLADGARATEADGREGPVAGGPVSGGGDRSATARHVLALAGQDIRTVLVRLPPATHGTGDNGFTDAAVAAARTAGASVYVGDGQNQWPAVHRDDAATLFRLALEAVPAGTVLHAVAEEGVPIREVAEAIGYGLHLPALSVSKADAGRYLGFLGTLWGLNGPASSEATRRLTGWTPVGPSWIEDLRSDAYFLPDPA